MIGDFSIFMTNELRFSMCTAPNVPTSEPVTERLLVELSGNLLTIAEAPEGSRLGNTLYGQRTLDLPDGSSAFMFLLSLPSGATGGRFFPAIGTVVVANGHGGHTLRAAGTDTNTGSCKGWIFDAREIVPAMVKETVS